MKEAYMIYGMCRAACPVLGQSGLHLKPPRPWSDENSKRDIRPLSRVGIWPCPAGQCIRLKHRNWVAERRRLIGVLLAMRPVPADSPPGECWKSSGHLSNASEDRQCL